MDYIFYFHTMAAKISVLLLLFSLETVRLTAQTWLSYLEKPALSGIHIHQDSVSKICTIVAGSDDLVSSPTFIYQLDSNARILNAKKIEACGKNITSSACSNHNRTVISRSILTSTGQLTANLICFDRRLNVQWSSIVESNHIAYVNASRIDAAGNVFVVGNGMTRPPSKNYSFLCKINAHGEKGWELTDFASNDTVAFWRLAVDDQGNTYTIGSVGKRGLLAKINAGGHVEWQQTVYYRGETRLSAIAVSGGFVYVLGADEGSTSEEGKVFISKMTATGQAVWTTLMSTAAHRFSPNHAAIKTTANGDIVLALYGLSASQQRAWATIHLDQSGLVVQSTTYQNNAHESLPRDLYLGKNATVTGIGTLTTLGGPSKYPFFLKSTWPDLLGGRCCFASFRTIQKSVQLNLSPANIDFVNHVVINLVDFPLVTKEDACIITQLKN